MNKELIAILYSIRCKAIQGNLCRQIGFQNKVTPLCINGFNCLECVLHKTPNSKFYPNRIAITSLNLLQEGTHE